jgi:hypothetical protein
VLDLGDLINVLEGDLATHLMSRVHRTTQSVLPGFDIGGVEEEVGGGRGAEVKVEGSIGADGDTRGNGDTGVNVSCAGIEFLRKLSIRT